MSEIHYAPISELSGDIHAGLTWNAEVPSFASPDQIGVHVMKLEKIAHLGRVAHITVDSEALETDSYDARIAGIDVQGTATAAKVTTRQARLSDFEIYPPGMESPDMQFDTAPADVRLILNSAAILDNVRREHGSVRNPAGWAHQINDALKEGTWNLIQLNLALRPPLVRIDLTYSGETYRARVPEFHRLLAVRGLLAVTKLVKQLK